MKTALTDRAKHTPGPWKAAYNKPYDQWWVSQFDGNPVATTKQEANAHLIAGAPDLLAALRTIADHWSPNVGRRHPEIIEHVRAAIAKAEGGS